MKKKSHKLIFSVLTVLLALCLAIPSCKKDIPQINPPEKYLGGNFDSVFEAFWEGMNHNYMFWAIDSTDWDAVYRKYKPRFASLNMNDPDDIYIAYTYFQEMTANLVDGHYAIIFNPAYAAYLPSLLINPAKQKKQAKGILHHRLPDTFFRYVIPNIYNLTNLYDAEISFYNPILGDTVNMNLECGYINNSILYFHYSDCFLYKSCMLALAGDSTYQDALVTVRYFFSQLKNPSLKGLILDLRNNGGGDIEDLNFIAGNLADKPYVFGAARRKWGDGRLDYTPWVDAYIDVNPNAKRFKKPIVVLTDAYTGSAAELTTMAIKAMPDVRCTVVGERTWGCHGGLAFPPEIFNGGVFQTTFCSMVYTPNEMFRYKNGQIYEGLGFPPDILVRYNAAAIFQNKDPQLERAISLFN